MSHGNHPHRAVVLAIITVLAVAVPEIGIAAAASGEITTCTTIEQSGTYVLADSIADSTAGTCLLITASDVVLDGQDNLIDGTDGTGTRGIALGFDPEGIDNVTIRNVRVADWGIGIELRNASELTVSGSTATSNVGPGLAVNGSIDVTVRQSVFVENRPGVRVDGSYRAATAIVDDNSFDANTVGIVLTDADGTEVRRNTITNGRFDGVRGGTNDTLIANNTITGNGYHGVSFYKSFRNTVRDNELRLNGKTGVDIGRSNATTVLSNTIAANGEAGIYLHPQGLEIGKPGYSSDNIIRNNTFTGRGAARPGSGTDHVAAVRLELATYNRIEGNNISAYPAGIEFFMPDDPDPEAIDPIGLNQENVITGNRITDTGVGIYVNEWDSNADEYYTIDNTIYDNYLNNSVNARFNDGNGEFGIVNPNDWNVTPRAGTNVIGGSSIAGNFWAAPTGDGFSQTCSDTDGNGICDSGRSVGKNNTDAAPLAAPAVVSEAAPIAVFEYTPGTPIVGSEVVFNASGSSDPDGTIASYEWDFDADGVFEGDGARVNRSFASAGDYPVTLQVTDNDSLTNQTTRTVSVIADDPTPDPGTETVQVTEHAPACALPGEQIRAVLNVTDLDDLRIRARIIGPMEAANLTLVVDGEQREFGELITFEPAKTGNVTVRVKPEVGVFGKVALEYEDAGGTLLAVTGPTGVHPDPIRVPANVSTVQAAVNIACTGGTVAVEPSVYEETVTVRGEVTIRNVSGSPVLASTVDRVLVVAPGGNLTLVGMTVRGPVEANLLAPSVAVRMGGQLVTEGISVSGGYVGLTGIGRVEISNSRFHGQALAILSRSGDVVVRNTTINTSLRGVEAAADGSVLLADNTIKAMNRTEYLDGIWVRDVRNGSLDIIRNHIHTSNGIVLSEVDHGTVKQNRVDSGGVEARGSSGIRIRSANVSLRGNRIDGSGSGIRIIEDASVALDGTIITNASVFGVYVSESDLAVRNASITESWVGIRSEKNTSLQAVGNTIAADVGGVLIRGNTTGSVDSNRIGASRIGIRVRGPDSNVTVSGNTIRAIEDRLERAIQIDERATGRITSNDIDGATGHGVLIENAGPTTIRGNEIRNTTDESRYLGRGAVLVTGATDVTISDNLVVNSSRSPGIRVGPFLGFPVTGEIRNNTILDSDRAGIVIGSRTNRVEVANNTIQRATDGIDVRMGDGGRSFTIATNRIRNITHHGIELDPQAAFVRGIVRGNHISEVGDTGIIVKGDEGERTYIGLDLHDNIVSEAGDAGIVVRNGSQIRLRGNEISDIGPDRRAAGVYVGAAGDIDRFKGNSVQGARYGLSSRAARLSARTGGVTCNDFAGVTNLSIDNQGHTISAPLNYFGPEGPSEAIRYEQSIGRVSELEPFLTAPVGAGCEATQAFGYTLTFDAGDIYAFGAAGPLARSLSETFTEFEGAVYLYDASSDAWTLATGEEELNAMEAIAIVPTTDTRAVVDYADATPPRPTVRQLARTGWHFVGARIHTDAEEAFSTRTVGVTDLLHVFAEPDDQPFGAGDDFSRYTFSTNRSSSGGSGTPTVSPFTGYFVYVDDPGSIPGAVPAGVTAAEIEGLLEIEAV